TGNLCLLAAKRSWSTASVLREGKRAKVPGGSTTRHQRLVVLTNEGQPASPAAPQLLRRRCALP
ncbi:MAG TPA: hypothetical protein VK425_07330, partial [Acidimicrobiales bacterium]|nr:hypothetical protein [Acidimicrobiales bacterium]